MNVFLSFRRDFPPEFLCIWHCTLLMDKVPSIKKETAPYNCTISVFYNWFGIGQIINWARFAPNIPVEIKAKSFYFGSIWPDLNLFPHIYSFLNVYLVYSKWIKRFSLSGFFLLLAQSVKAFFEWNAGYCRFVNCNISMIDRFFKSLRVTKEWLCLTSF